MCEVFKFLVKLIQILTFFFPFNLEFHVKSLFVNPSKVMSKTHKNVKNK